MELTKIYASVLEALHVRTTPEGLLSYESFDGSVPLSVRDGNSSRRLVLPTEDVLRQADWDTLIPFHPLSEHLNRGVSPVMNTLIKTATLRLTEVVSNLLHQLISIAADPKRHAKISPQAQKFLTPLKDANTKTVEALEKILKRIDMTPERKLVSIYLKRKGVYKGMTGRVCAIGFPIMDELANADRTVWGVKLSQKEIAMIEAAMQYILPGCDDIETYSALCDSKVAPYFESFLEAYEKVATQLNKVVHTSRKELQLVEKLTSKMEWGNLSEDLYKHRSTIPPLDGNKGTLLDDRSQENVSEGKEPTHRPLGGPAMVSPTAPVMPPHQVTTLHHNPSPSNDGESMSEKLARQRARTMSAPTGYPQPSYPPGYQMPGYPPVQPGMYPQPMPGYPMPPGYPPSNGYPMGMPMQPQPGYPYQMQPQPGYPAGYVDPNQPVWMNTPNGSVTVASTPAPIQPNPYGMPSGGGGGYLFR